MLSIIHTAFVWVGLMTWHWQCEQTSSHFSACQASGLHFLLTDQAKGELISYSVTPWVTCEVLFCFFSPPLLEKHSIGKPSVIPWSLNTNILGAKLWFPGPQQPMTWGGLSHSETLCIHWVSWLTLLLVLGLGFGVAFLHFSQCWNKRVCTAA